MTDPWLLTLLGLLLGAVMGLLGGGGAVLAVPLLVHLVGLPFDEAASTSLMVVLVGALAGLLGHRGSGRTDWRTGLRFGLLGVLGAALGSAVSGLLAEPVLLGAFTVLLLLAGLSMLRGGLPVARGFGTRPGRWRVLWLATALGFVTGLLGVGGGFLVVPVLVVALGVPVHTATATGLVVLAVNAVTALLSRVGLGLAVDARLAGWLVGGVLVGALVAARLSRRVPAGGLRTGFGGLVLVVAVLTGVQAALAGSGA